MHRQTQRVMFSRSKESTKNSAPSKNSSAELHKLYAQDIKYLDDWNFML